MEAIIQRWAPIAISVLSLIFSGIALGWNVYRDVILKARVKVSVSVIHVVDPGQRFNEGDQFIRIGVSNHGPGPVQIQMIVGERAGFWRRLSRRAQHFFVLADHTNPLSPKLPAKMEVGDTVSLLLPYDERSFLNGAATHVGISDSFGRSHFAPRRQLRTAKAQFTKDFPDAKTRQDV